MKSPLVRPKFCSLPYLIEWLRFTITAVMVHFVFVTPVLQGQRSVLQGQRDRQFSAIFAFTTTSESARGLGGREESGGPPRADLSSKGIIQLLALPLLLLLFLLLLQHLAPPFPVQKALCSSWKYPE